jgi:selenophosphate synthetase-related protein
MDEQIRKYVVDIEWIRDRLSNMDEMLDPVLGIRDWDDAVCLDFKGKLVASTDGPYTKRLVMKSALVHAATDVVVKGAKPIFALDTLIGVRKEVEDMLDSLKKQAEAIQLPLIGGNTLFEDVEPRCNLIVVGKLLLDEPIRDSGAEKDDVIVLVGEPIWGEQNERLEKAKTLFQTWFDALECVKFNSAKDVTKGGLVSVVYEMQEKSKKKFKLVEEIPYSQTRNLDNFIATLTEYEYVNLEKVCMQHDCRLVRIGTVE